MTCPVCGGPWEVPDKIRLLGHLLVTSHGIVTLAPLQATIVETLLHARIPLTVAQIEADVAHKGREGVDIPSALHHGLQPKLAEVGWKLWFEDRHSPTPTKYYLAEILRGENGKLLTEAKPLPR